MLERCLFLFFLFYPVFSWLDATTVQVRFVGERYIHTYLHTKYIGRSHSPFQLEVRVRIRERITHSRPILCFPWTRTDLPFICLLRALQVACGGNFPQMYEGM